MVTARIKFRAALTLVLSATLSACATYPTEEDATNAEMSIDQLKAVRGYWAYDGLVTSQGQSLPIDGVFLFEGGVFLQQAVMGDPADSAAEAMAHAGPYTATEKGVDLKAQQTISISGSMERPLSFRANTDHQLTVTGSDDNLKLVFGSGTVQTFTRIASGPAEIYTFDNGRLAFIDNRFILVLGDSTEAVSGYGTFTRSGDKLALNAERWASATDTNADIAANKQIVAHFDGNTLPIAPNRSFRIIKDDR